MTFSGMTLFSRYLPQIRVSLWKSRIGKCIWSLTSCCVPLFPCPQKREAFCQLLQLMKNKHSKQDEPDMISVFIGTWNMGQAQGYSRGGGWPGTGA